MSVTKNDEKMKVGPGIDLGPDFMASVVVVVGAVTAAGASKAS